MSHDNQVGDDFKQKWVEKKEQNILDKFSNSIFSETEASTKKICSFFRITRPGTEFLHKTTKRETQWF